MSKLVNLRQFRKQRTRDDKRARGDANAVKSGEAQRIRRLREVEARRAERAHDAHRRDD